MHGPASLSGAFFEAAKNAAARTLPGRSDLFVGNAVMVGRRVFLLMSFGAPWCWTAGAFGYRARHQ